MIVQMLRRRFLSSSLLALSLAAPASAVGQDGKMEALKIQLPKPMFAGTPKDLRTPNLEPTTGKPREPFLVPVGTALVSIGKRVTSSDRDPMIGELPYVTDGRNSGDDASYVELGPRLQWVQIDLGKSSSLTAIVVWHYHSQPRVYFDVVVRASDDPQFISKVTTLFNNDHDNSSGLGVGKDREYIETSEGKLIDGRGANARYLRLYSAGNTSNDLNHYVEVQVFGVPAK